MNKKHINSFKNSKIWDKKFKDLNDTIDNGIMKDENIDDLTKASQLIITTADLMKDLGEKYLEKYDLSIAQKGVLAVLYFCKKEYLTQIEISKFVYTSKSNISVLIDRMEKKNFIRREENKENKRENKIIITKNGKNKFEKLLKDSEKLPINNILTLQEAKKLKNLLVKVKMGYKEIFEK